MKILIIGNRARTEKYLPELPIVHEADWVVAERGTSDADLLALASDAEVIFADAISLVSAELIAGMPKLKMIHSEGVAFNAIDCVAARAHGIDVCNNKGANAVAVAEQTMMLMLGICKFGRVGDIAVRSGHQIEVKEQLMVSGIGEISGSTVGLIGFGDIAREVAKRCRAFGARVLYNKRTPLMAEEERELGVSFATRDELLVQSDFVSVHCPVTPMTLGMCDDAFFAKMKDGAYLINTARGEMVDNEACVRALESGRLAGAAFDTVAPEPVTLDNPLLQLKGELADKVLFAPHIGGVTSNMFTRAHRFMWENAARVAAGEKPLNVVNG